MARSGLRTPPTNAVSSTWPSGARPGKDGGGEDDAEHVAPLHVGHQEAEPVERVGHVLAAEAEGEHRDRRVVDAGERLDPVAALEGEVDLVGAVGRRGVDHPVVQLRRLIRRARPSTPWGPRRSWVTGALKRSSDRSSRASASGSSWSPPAKEISAGPAAPPGLAPGAHHLPQRLHHRAVGVLQVVQPRQGVADRELLGVAGEDAGRRTGWRRSRALPG